jgi:hypothetical protein
MSAEKLRAVTAMLDAWEAARVCLWHKINALLAEKGTRKRLREENGTRARLPKPPAGSKLAAAMSALRVAARGFALHELMTNQTRWLYVGNCPMTEQGLLSDPDRLEHYLHEIFDGYAAGDPDADFWQREIVGPTMKHAEDMRTALKKIKAEAVNTEDLEIVSKAVEKHGVNAPVKAIVAEVRMGEQKVRNLLRQLKEYKGFARERPRRYPPPPTSEG